MLETTITTEHIKNQYQYAVAAKRKEYDQTLDKLAEEANSELEKAKSADADYKPFFLASALNSLTLVYQLEFRDLQKARAFSKFYLAATDAGVPEEMVFEKIDQPVGYDLPAQSLSQ